MCFLYCIVTPVENALREKEITDIFSCSLSYFQLVDNEKWKKKSMNYQREKLSKKLIKSLK